MDPLDRRLADAGAAWRETQPDPPELDRMVAALRGRRSVSFHGRSMYAFVSALLVIAALVVAPGVGSFLQRLDTQVPAATATPSSSAAQPSPTPDASTTPTPSPSTRPSPSIVLSDAETATNLVASYEAGLVAGDWATAFGLLASTSPTHEAGLATYAAERAQFFASVGGRYTLKEPTAPTDWASYGPTVAGADRSRALVIEVDYPALAGNNAGYEQFVVAPDPSGTWRIWPVR